MKYLIAILIAILISGVITVMSFKASQQKNVENRVGYNTNHEVYQAGFRAGSRVGHSVNIILFPSEIRGLDKAKCRNGIIVEIDGVYQYYDNCEEGELQNRDIIRHWKIPNTIIGSQGELNK